MYKAMNNNPRLSANYDVSHMKLRVLIRTLHVIQILRALLTNISALLLLLYYFDVRFMHACSLERFLFTACADIEDINRFPL